MLMRVIRGWIEQHWSWCLCFLHAASDSTIKRHVVFSFFVLIILQYTVFFPHHVQFRKQSQSETRADYNFFCREAVRGNISKLAWVSFFRFISFGWLLREDLISGLIHSRMRNEGAKRFCLIGVEAKLCEAERDQTARPSGVTEAKACHFQFRQRGGKRCRGHGTPSHVHLPENDISCPFKLNLAVHVSLRYQPRPSLLTERPESNLAADTLEAMKALEDGHVLNPIIFRKDMFKPIKSFNLHTA